MRRLVVVVLTVLLGAAGALVAPTASADPSPQGRANAKGYYLALGASLAAGYQPGVGHARAGGSVGQVLTAMQRSAPPPAATNAPRPTKPRITGPRHNDTRINDKDDGA